MRRRDASENLVRTNEAVDNTSRTSSDVPTIDKELLVNINCNIGLIRDYIRESVRLEPTDEYDLWEESTSQLSNICSLNPWTSGLDVFQPNDTYFLILIERNSNGQLINYVPLIGGKMSRALADIIGKTRRLSKKKSSAMVTLLRDKIVRKKLSGKS